MLPPDPGRPAARWLNSARVFLILATATLIIWACQLTQGNSARQTLSFTKLYDSLSQYDSLVIEVKDPAEAGITDTVFNGRAQQRSDLENLAAPHYHGASAIIIITGFKNGKIALRLDKQYDGTTDKTTATDSLILPNIALTPDSASLHLKAGDTADLPKVTVNPAGLADKVLLWTTSNGAVVTVSGTRMIAISAGTATLTAKLKANPDKSTTISVTVTATDSVPAPQAPDAPVIGSVSAGDAKVTLVWAAVPGADAYNVYYGEGGAVDKGSTRIKNATSPYEVKGLKNGVDYGFSLSAANAAGESGLSETKVATPQLPAPSAPAIDSVAVGNGNVTLSWKPVPGALAYVLYYKSGNDVDKSGTRVPGISSPYTLSGLANGTQYAFVLTTIMAAGESGLGNVVTATPQAPAAAVLSYLANPAVYWRSVAITANTATFSGAADSFTVTPALPAGLTLAKSTGAITGTPTAASANAIYTVKAKYAGGEAAVALAITVNGAPAGLTYSENPAAYWQTLAIATNTATVSGIIDSFTVTPALPVGLVLSKTTGAISGTPSAIAASAAYTVTAWNKAGSTSTPLLISVKGPPSGISYASNPAVYWQGVAATPNTATVTGTVDSFTVVPALPAGLSLDKASGSISGTPTAAIATATYAITAKNAAGSPQVTLTITVNGPPSTLSYTSPAPGYWQNVAIAPNTAAVTGIVDSFTVTPALPAGLSLNKTTGEIKGTPLAAAAAAKYVVTARNKSGTATAELNFAVKGPPSGFSYAANPATYTKSTAITANTAAISGTVDSFTVTPALPAGLLFTKGTGGITGTPTSTVPASDYTVTAYNPAGTATVKLNIAVLAPLSGLSYAVNPAVYWKSVPIAANTASLTGAPDSFTVTPALPAGLTLNKSTGAISGTPTAAAASAVYQITAKSSASGNVTANLTLTVNGPPAGLSYALNPATYWKGVAIAGNAATVTGIVDSFTVSPALPAGLSLSKATGMITGTPSAAAAAAAYIVTAKNPAGSVTVSLSITVNGPPTLAYAPTTASWYKSTAITALTPATTGVIDSVTVTPALPAGLTLTAATGRISGTPTATANGSYVFTAWNKAGTAKDTMGIVISLPGTPLAIQKDLTIDSSNAFAYNNGYTGAAFLGSWPAGAYQVLMQFDLSTVSLTGFDSAKVILKTYAYGPNWNGSPVTLKAHIFKIKHTWTEGTGNWYWNANNWQNEGDVILANYEPSDAIKAASTNPTAATGNTYLDRYLVRSDSLIPVGTQNVTMTYPAASIHHDFNSPIPGPANLVDMELDLSSYVRDMAGNSADCGFIIYLENLPSANDYVGTMTKEAGDGSYGPKLYLYY